MKGIDVSSYQGIINWEQVKQSGIDFAIIRCGYGDDIRSQDDKYFERNYSECQRLGIPVGAYLYSYADSIEHAKSEAEHTLRLIRNKKFECGIWYDLEDESTTGKISNAEIAKITKVYCDRIENEGYTVGIYANKYWFTTKLTSNMYNNYMKWVASYGKNNGDVPNDIYKYKGEHQIWQYTSKGNVEGINGNVDLNISYGEFIEPLPEKINVIYQAYVGNRWLPNVKNLEDYAGIYGKPITGVYINSSDGDIEYKVHLKYGWWLPEVINRTDYAGILGSSIDALMIKSTKGQAKYRVHIINEDWLPWVSGYDMYDSESGYAGIIGKVIDGIQIEIV